MCVSPGCTAVVFFLGDTSSLGVVGLLSHPASAAGQAWGVASARRHRYSVISEHQHIHQQYSAHQASLLYRVRRFLLQYISEL